MIVAELNGLGNGITDLVSRAMPQAEKPAPTNHSRTLAAGRRGIKGLLVANATLTPVEEQMRAAIVARDYDKLFSFAPSRAWAYDVPLGKYSFREVNGRRVYVPFSRADLAKFLFSRHMNVQPGYTCSDAQKQAMVEHYVKASNAHIAKFPSTEPAHIYPIFPGRDICYKEKKSTWDKLKPLAIAAVVVTGGIFLGKAVIAGAAKSSAAGAAKAGLIGAGSKAGAVTALTTKAGIGTLATKAGTLAALKTGAGTAAAVFGAAGGMSTGATTAGGIVGTAAKAMPIAEKVINGARTLDALAKGELPPPPISLGDRSLSDYANLVGEKLAEREMQKALDTQERAMLAEMIERERQYLARYETPHLPVVNSGLNPALTAAQKTRADGAMSEGSLLKVLAIAVPVIVLLARSG